MGFGKFFSKIFNMGAGGIPRNNPDIQDHIAAQVRLAQGHSPIDPRSRDSLHYLQLTNGTF